MILPNAQSLTEDFSRVGGFIAGCGQASALVVAHIVNGTPISVDELTRTIQDSVNANVGATYHGSTPQASQWVLAQKGINSNVTFNPSNLQSLIDTALAQGKPVELGISNGSMLTGEPSGLRGHYVTIVGENSPTNYIVADPNTQQSKMGTFVNDTLQQFQAANPFAAIVPNTGAGPDTGNSSNNSTSSNPIDIIGAIGNIGNSINNLPQNIANNLWSGIGSNISKQTGLTDITDVGWRTALILVGMFLVTIAIIFIAYDLLDKSNVEVAGSRV